MCIPCAVARLAELTDFVLLPMQSPNLVCDAHWRVKVTDFNLCRVVGEQVYSASMVANNPRWLAPEVQQTLLLSASFAVV